MQEPQIMHTYNVKQEQYQEWADSSRAKWLTILCQDNEKHEKHTTLKYKKVNNKMYRKQICDTMHANKELSHLVN